MATPDSENAPAPARATSHVQPPASTPVEPAPVPNQTAATASTPANAAIPQPDQADPKTACISLFHGLRDRNVKEIADAIASADPERTRQFCDIMPVMFAISDLSQACLTRFGETRVDHQSLDLQANALDQWSARVPTAMMKIEGDTATIDLRGADEMARFILPMEFRRVNGAWKLWLKQAPNEKEVRLARHADALVAMLRDMICEVEAGQFDTVQDVRDAMERRAEAEVRAASERGAPQP